MVRITDEDERQEYECLLLEGHTPAEARKLARKANDRINSKRLSGPLTGDTRHGHGVRPLVTDFNAEATSGVYENVVPLTVDTRSDWERSRDWDRSDLAHKCLTLMTPRQQEVVRVNMGFDGDMSYQEKARVLGIRTENVWKASNAGVTRARRQLFGFKQPAKDVTDVTKTLVVGG
jgi:DNA-directed RNA polymerase specialized sigma24 family protein